MLPAHDIDLGEVSNQNIPDFTSVRSDAEVRSAGNRDRWMSNVSIEGLWRPLGNKCDYPMLSRPVPSCGLTGTHSESLARGALVNPESGRYLTAGVRE